MTLDDIVKLLSENTIDKRNHKKIILECGATHLAVDECGEVYAWKGEPEPNELSDGSCGEWLGYGKAQCTLYFGDIPHPADSGQDWKELLIKLP